MSGHLQIQATLQSPVPPCVTLSYFHLVALPSQRVCLKGEQEAGESWRGVPVGHFILPVFLARTNHMSPLGWEVNLSNAQAG